MAELTPLGSLDGPEQGRNLVHLRQVQPIAAVLDWDQQRRLWRKLPHV